MGGATEQGGEGVDDLGVGAAAGSMPACPRRSSARTESRLDGLRRWRILARVQFDWDPAKDSLNRDRHGIGFDEAVGVFAPGSRWLDMDDEAHSADEIRYRAIGAIARGVVLVVYTERDGDVVRIISARKATAREKRLYEDWIEEYP